VSNLALAPVDIEYPSTDGKPVAESDFQLNYLIYARESLRVYFRDQLGRDDIYVAGNLLIYYEEGNPRESVAPDVSRSWRSGCGSSAAPPSGESRPDPIPLRRFHAGRGLRPVCTGDRMGRCRSRGG